MSARAGQVYTHTLAIRAQISAGYLAGKSLGEIAEEVGRTRSAVNIYAIKMGLKFPRTGRPVGDGRCLGNLHPALTGICATGKIRLAIAAILRAAPDALESSALDEILGSTAANRISIMKRVRLRLAGSPLSIRMTSYGYRAEWGRA